MFWLTMVNHHATKVNYFKLFNEVYRSDIYYLNTKCEAIIFTFSFVGNWPELEHSKWKSRMTKHLNLTIKVDFNQTLNCRLL